MNRTQIEWCDFSWNPTSGCSFGCPYCYARAMSRRFHRSFEPTCHPQKLDEPLKLKQPSLIFVDSNGDLFDPAIPSLFINKVLDVVELAGQHTLLVLTKQAERMCKLLNSRCSWSPYRLPLNLWLGVTVEHQAAADERIPLLLQTPAAVRFISVEPLLGPIDLGKWIGGGHDQEHQGSREDRLSSGFGRRTGDRQRGTGLESSQARLGQMEENDRYSHEIQGELRGGLAGCKGHQLGLGLVIIGNDSRPGAKMPEPTWVEDIIAQCRAAGVPLFVKGKLAQVPEWNIQEWPKELPR